MFFFRDVVGHDTLKDSLIRTVQTDSMAHAQLFCGPEGIGKFAMAMAYARYIHCTNRGVDDACGKCASCMQYNALTHADLHFVFPIVRGKEKKKALCDNYLPQWTHFIQENPYFGIDKWLKAINADNKQAAIYADESDAIWHKMTLKSLSSPYKIMIVWLPERMNAECANKLLKLLEEPSPHTYFFFVSNEPTKLLPTVVSRMRRITMHVLPVDVISEALQHRYGVSEADARAVAALSGGSYLHACEALSLNEETDAYFDLFVKVMRLAYARRIKDLKEWSEEVAGFGRERIRHFLSYAERMIRENYIYNLAYPDLNYMNVKERQFSSRFAPFINERNVLDIRKLLEDANNDIAQNANAKIVMFDFCINLILLLKK